MNLREMIPSKPRYRGNLRRASSSPLDGLHEQLDQMFRAFYTGKKSLKEAHQATFDVSLDEGTFNAAQVFVVMTNGVDHKTREAVQYWRSRGLDVRHASYQRRTGVADKVQPRISHLDPQQSGQVPTCRTDKGPLPRFVKLAHLP